MTSKLYTFPPPPQQESHHNRNTTTVLCNNNAAKKNSAKKKPPRYPPEGDHYDGIATKIEEILPGTAPEDVRKKGAHIRGVHFLPQEGQPGNPQRLPEVFRDASGFPTIDLRVAK
jgi:hypothetical protein